MPDTPDTRQPATCPSCGGRQDNRLGCDQCGQLCQDSFHSAHPVSADEELPEHHAHLIRWLRSQLAAAEARAAEAERERDENEGVIKVWRRRTEEAEAENERLREALERLRAEFIEHADGIEEADRDDDPLSEAATARMESYREFVSRLALLIPKHPQDDG